MPTKYCSSIFIFLSIYFLQVLAKLFLLSNKSGKINKLFKKNFNNTLPAHLLSQPNPLLILQCNPFNYGMHRKSLFLWIKAKGLDSENKVWLRRFSRPSIVTGLWNFHIKKVTFMHCFAFLGFGTVRNKKNGS